ncbi:hypothetical protein BJ742DRAFT_876351 [Cladochytrium replicatum]|nr:hypothetical protein BJ742DRAFT_876351 [Cladochytrium replicatum]
MDAKASSSASSTSDGDKSSGHNEVGKLTNSNLSVDTMPQLTHIRHGLRRSTGGLRRGSEDSDFKSQSDDGMIPSLKLQRQGRTSVSESNHSPGGSKSALADGSVAIPVPQIPPPSNMDPPPNRYSSYYSPRLSLARQPHLAPPPPLEPSPPPKPPPPPPPERIEMPEPFEEAEPIPSLLEQFIVWIEQPLDSKGNLFQTWTKLTNILHLFNIIIAPLLFSWTQHFQTLAWIVLFSSVDLVFCIDCFIQSRLHFKNEYGVLIESYTQLRDNYLFRRFGWIQTVSSLPWDLFAFLPTQYSTIHFDSLRTEDDVEYFHFKIWGIIRFVKMFFRAPYERIYEARIAGVALPISRLIKTMVILMVLGHFDACLFWFIDLMLDPPDRWMDAKHLYILEDGNEAEFATQYLTSYLTALRSLVLKLREVNKNAENVFVVFEFIAGILAYGTVFGNIHSIVEMLDHTAASTKADLDPTEERHKYEMNWLRQYMRDKGLQPELQKMVNAHKEIQWRRSQGMDEAHLFDDIPKSLQQEIKNYLYLELVQKVPLFQNTDSHFQNSVTFKIKPLVVLNDWYIFRKGDEAEEMYFVKNGTVEICGNEGQVFAKLGPGNFFGEIALFEDTKRTAGARASGTVELCVLTKDDFNQIMNQYPMIAERIRQAIRERKANEQAVKQKKEAEAAAAAARPQLSVLKHRGSEHRHDSHRMPSLMKAFKGSNTLLSKLSHAHLPGEKDVEKRLDE